MKTITVCEPIGNYSDVPKKVQPYNINLYADLSELLKCCWFLRETKTQELLEFPKMTYKLHTLELVKPSKKCILADEKTAECSLCTIQTVVIK